MSRSGIEVAAAQPSDPGIAGSNGLEIREAVPVILEGILRKDAERHYVVLRGGAIFQIDTTSLLEGVLDEGLVGKSVVAHGQRCAPFVIAVRTLVSHPICKGAAPHTAGLGSGLDSHPNGHALPGYKLAAPRPVEALLDHPQGNCADFPRLIHAWWARVMTRRNRMPCDDKR